MAIVTIKGLNFEPYISREEIQKQVLRVAQEIRRDYENNELPPVFVCVLNGSFIFAADLFRAVNLEHSEITFIRFKSYEGTSSTGEITQVMGLAENITGRDVIIVEDIVDTGVTAKALRAILRAKNPKSMKMATLLYKPASLTTGEVPEYVGFEIPSRFILGYGLDLDGEARSLPDIYVKVD
ncbi:MAG: hypoxanthine phosphoribosyltransferase [Muribaculaceae bacterium]|nr:hypoxanthine phosphoribosyltransferase [Muribaculaceae bacterium]